MATGRLARRVGTGLLLVAAGAIAVLLVWQVPQWQTAPSRALLTPRDLLLVQNELRQTMVLCLGVGAILAALAVVWRRVAANERAARDSLAAAQAAQRDEHFTRAIAQLADERLEVRIGAVYGLEQIVAESAARHWPVIEVLSAFLRSRAGWDAERPPPLTLPTDVQAVLTVLGRRNRAHERDEQLDLRRTDLRGADLNRVDFSRAILFEAHLEGASLQGAQLVAADLRRAHLGNADLVEANLRGADLREAHLESAYLVEAHLEGADLGGAHLAGAYLGGAHLEGADLGGAHLDGTYLYKAHLEGASLRGARMVSAIGMHRDERERVNRNVDPHAVTPLPPPRPRRKMPQPAEESVSLRSRGRR